MFLSVVVLSSCQSFFPFQCFSQEQPLSLESIECPLVQFTVVDKIELQKKDFVCSRFPIDVEDTVVPSWLVLEPHPHPFAKLV